MTIIDPNNVFVWVFFVSFFFCPPLSLRYYLSAGKDNKEEGVNIHVLESSTGLWRLLRYRYIPKKRGKNRRKREKKRDLAIGPVEPQQHTRHTQGAVRERERILPAIVCAAGLLSTLFPSSYDSPIITRTREEEEKKLNHTEDLHESRAAAIFVCLFFFLFCILLSFPPCV